MENNSSLGYSNKLYRLGDSWSQVQSQKYPNDFNHSYHIAEHYKLEYVNVGHGGAACFDVLTQLISIMFDCKKGDMLLVGIPSLRRVGYIDNKNNYISSAKYSNEELLKMESIKLTTNTQLQKVINKNIVHQINKILYELKKRGTKVYTMFNDEQGYFETINCIPIFFSRWIQENNWQDLSSKGNMHFVVGKQKDIAKGLIKLIDKIDNGK